MAITRCSMTSGLEGVTSNVVGDGLASPLSIKAGVIMLVVIIILAAYLIYRHRKHMQNADQQS